MRNRMIVSLKVLFFCVLIAGLYSCGTTGKIKFAKANKALPSTSAHQSLKSEAINSVEVVPSENITAETVAAVENGNFNGSTSVSLDDDLSSQNVSSIATQENKPLVQNYYVAKAPPVSDPELKTKTAKAALVFGYLSFIPLAGFIFGILAISLGSAALLQIKKHPDEYGGEDDARQGRRLALSAWVIAVLIMLLIVLFAVLP